VLVHFPRGGQRTVEEERYPREQYWERLVAGTSALTFHAEDVPALASFAYPDGSHLDMKDTATFTRLLADRVETLVSARSSRGSRADRRENKDG
jgi:hypothetical protein